MDKDYAKALDEVLKAIDESNGFRFINDDTEHFINLRKRIKEKYELKGYQYESLLDKLEDDKLMKRHGQPFEHYDILFNGMDFLKQGGYSNERYKQKVDLYFKIINIILIAIAAIMAAWYSGFEIWRYFYGYVRPC